MSLLEFSYITFVNNNHQYLSLMQVLLQSVLLFSKHSIIIYLIDVSFETKFLYFKNYIQNPRFIFHSVDNVVLPSIYYYKPYCIIHSLEKYTKSGYYVESNDIILPNCDKLQYVANALTMCPISPIHPDDVFISNYDISQIDETIVKTQHYIHAHVVFHINNIIFLKEWFIHCLKGTYRFADETALNITYWKYKCNKHYLDIIDPYFEQFYTTGPEILKTAYTLHGCKCALTQQKLLNDVKNYLKDINVC